ncbi:MAG: FMN-binding protein, partial [Blautia sp.]|nr:FMN-binding protein [Blautia sp.]
MADKGFKGLKGLKVPEVKGKRFHNDDLKKALIALGGSIVLVAGLHGLDALATNIAQSMRAANMTPAGEFTPGTYTGEAKGIGTVKVSLTFNETNLMEAEIDTSEETPDIGGVATETLKQALLDAQAPEFDAVAGATVTSDAVMAAAKQAFNAAAGIEEEEAPEEAPAEEAAEEEAPAEEAPMVEAGALTPGEYTASAQGIGNVTATVTIGEDGSIADVVLGLDEETPELGGAAGDTLKEAILAAQSADIDTVAGVTVTTEAVKAAVNACLAQAAGGAEEAAAEETAPAAAAGLVAGEYTASATGMG